jgi:hypothetical protein
MAYTSLVRIVSATVHETALANKRKKIKQPMSVYGGSFNMFMHVAAIGKKSLAFAGAPPWMCMRWI